MSKAAWKDEKYKKPEGSFLPSTQYVYIDPGEYGVMPCRRCGATPGMMLDGNRIGLHCFGCNESGVPPQKTLQNAYQMWNYCQIEYSRVHPEDIGCYAMNQKNLELVQNTYGKTKMKGINDE